MLIIVFFAVAALVLMVAYHEKQMTPLSVEIPANENSQKELSTLTEKDFLTNTPSTNSKTQPQGGSTNVSSQLGQGLIGESKTPQEMIAEKNRTSQDFYGKVIDQYGQPIANTVVSGALITETDEGFEAKNYTVQSDAGGQFEFVGLYGADLNVKVKKEGYKMGERGEGYQEALGGKSNANNRALFTMWKLRGAEPLTGSSIDAKIPYDGGAVSFDTVSGKESPDGDFRIALSRSPLNIKRGKDKFSWAIKIEMLHGGLVEENDPYPYWAPGEGYQASFGFEIDSNDIAWKNQLAKNFYVKTSRGEYGRMHLEVFSALTPARLQADFSFNPSGSQNLEPDFSK